MVMPNISSLSAILGKSATAATAAVAAARQTSALDAALDLSVPPPPPPGGPPVPSATATGAAMGTGFEVGLYKLNPVDS
jgi:hypothetical protein